jgi:uncharacterized protein (DUF1697 family)
LTTYVALLRAVNVGGTGKLPMAVLRGFCETLGFQRVETYIASGNVVFDCDLPADKVRVPLQHLLLNYVGKEVGVLVRSALQMKAILEGNPFSDRDPKLTYAFFLDEKPAADALLDIRGRAGEEIGFGQREIYVYYPAGMGQSKLRIPATRLGTSRNLNTVAKLVTLSSRDRPQ